MMNNKQKIAIAAVTMTRGDRAYFLKLCKQYVKNQRIWTVGAPTVGVPINHIVVDYKPKHPSKKDITERFVRGCNTAFAQGNEVVLIFEDDDFYHDNYADFMVNSWANAGKPDLFGVQTSMYYHLKNRRYWEDAHPGRASLMNTLITKQGFQKIDFSTFDPVWTDIHLWKQPHLKKATTTYDKRLSLGIKHGVGLCGGIGHRVNWQFYRKIDTQDQLLQSITGKYYPYYKAFAR